MKTPLSSFQRHIGPALLAMIFLASAWHVFRTERQEGGPERVTLRVGHWLMHAGMRESFAEAAAEYERLHPGVVVEQIPVPIRSWNAWVRTQLIGGTAPDITGQLGLDEQLLGRHFVPLDERLDAPNPHNLGSPLEGVPWRDTFIDGLAAVRALNPNSGELTGVYLQLNSLRLFLNKRLLRLVTGSERPPATYAELRALREQVERYNFAHGTSLVPLASCGPYSQYLFQRLLPSQTQRLAIALSPAHTLRTTPVELATFLLDERLDYTAPEFRSSLALLRDVSSLMSPGYTQLQRDDALFTYLQQHALGIVAGSWDYGVFVRDADFETLVAPLPYPDRDDPLFGQHVLGLIAEGGGGPEGMLGVTRTSRHPELAFDFLRFLTSYRVATRFTENSKRISAVAGVPPPSEAPGLAPLLSGEVPGLAIDFQYFGAGHTYALFQRKLHELISPTGGVDAFLSGFVPELRPALRRDLTRHVANAGRAVESLDARSGLVLSLPPEAEDPAELSRLLEARFLRQLDRVSRRRHAEP